ncbi:MAG: hypothetical protein FD180_4462 [Planctomycetota bacterium]|nr:MAG: hypothetical protein FD180_4462 [Planctomycetota bacterium]
MCARISLVLLIASALAGCASGPSSEAAHKLGTVKESFETFRGAIAKEDYDAAYDTLSRDTRDRYPSQLLVIAFKMTATGQRYQRLISDSALVTAIEKSDGKSAVAVLRAPDVEADLADPGRKHFEMKSFRLVKEDEKWLVQFTLQEFFGIPEDQFFDYSRVTRKRDFRQRR